MVQDCKGMKFYYNNFDGNFLGFADDGDGNFDLIAVDITEEKFVPMFKKNVEAYGMI
jgi:hypothetical protein